MSTYTPPVDLDDDDVVRELADRLGVAVERVRHSVRFRKVSTRYAHVVARAYDGDIARAAADTDEQVAATVAAWEQAHGYGPVDWPAIGAAEHGDGER